MKTFVLQMRAYTEFVKRIEVSDTKDQIFDFRVKCDRCEGVFTVSCSFGDHRQKCPDCHQEQKWKIMTSRIDNAFFGHDEARDGTFVDIMRLKCFGATPTGFVSGNGWKVTADNGAVFENPDLSGQWIWNFNGHAAVVRNLIANFTAAD